MMMTLFASEDIFISLFNIIMTNNFNIILKFLLLFIMLCF